MEQVSGFESGLRASARWSDQGRRLCVVGAVATPDRWPEYHRRLREKQEPLHRAFAQRVKALSARGAMMPRASGTLFTSMNARSDRRESRRPGPTRPAKESCAHARCDAVRRHAWLRGWMRARLERT